MLLRSFDLAPSLGEDLDLDLDPDLDLLPDDEREGLLLCFLFLESFFLLGDSDLEEDLLLDDLLCLLLLLLLLLLLCLLRSLFLISEGVFLPSLAIITLMVDPFNSMPLVFSKASMASL